MWLWVVPLNICGHLPLNGHNSFPVPDTFVYHAHTTGLQTSTQHRKRPKLKILEGGDPDQNGFPACAWEDTTGPTARPKTGASKEKRLENHQNNYKASKKLLLAGFERPPNRTLVPEKGCMVSAGLGSTIEIFQGQPPPRKRKIYMQFWGSPTPPPRDGDYPRHFAASWQG